MKNKIYFLSMLIVICLPLIISSCNTGRDSGYFKVTFSVKGDGCTVKAVANNKEIKSGDSVKSGTTVTFTATLEAGYKGVRWNFGGGPVVETTEAENKTLTLTVTADTTVTAEAIVKR
ncbi:InlB B-repeat-containing protein [Treponema pedis]|uniref:InlB B-repeat-containing protein n=1 Tax=Treponema pedis TaxID=409322 RepID=UPI00197DF31D|nr:hypothetical protein [Treponema pedis]QSI05666.1 hypothetical protein DYQ05_12500 [Treponema pedis]